jgi:hypothetical protein
MSQPQKLTRLYCRHNRVVFRPQSVDEADEIITRLQQWRLLPRDHDVSPEMMVARGFVLKDGIHTYTPLPSAAEVAFRAADFDDDCLDPEYLNFSDEGRAIMKAFGQVMARQAAIESKLDRVLAEIAPPAPLRKPKIDSKPTGTP